MKLTEGFNLLATAPDGIKRLRELILSLAVQGKLVPQDPNDEPASELLKQIRAEKQRLIAEGKIKKDKPLPAISDEDKPFELPDGWEWAIGGELFSVIRGVTYQKDNASEVVRNGYTPLLRANNIQTSINLDDLVYVPEYLVSEEQVLMHGDLVVCLASGSKNLVGKAAPFYGLGNYSFGAFCGVIRPRVSAISKYLASFVAAPYYREFVSISSAGIGINNLKGTTLIAMPVPLPPLAEQSRIVAKVEELMALCDALEARSQLEAEQHACLTATLFDALAASESAHQLQENWARLAVSFDLVLDRPQAVDALEQTILQLAVRGLLVPQDPADEPASELLKQIRAEKDRLIAEGKIKKDKPLPAITNDEKPFELPRGWEWVRIPEVCSIGGGATPSKSNSRYWDGDLPWVSPKDMKVDIIHDSQDHVSRLATLETRLPLIPENSLLIVVRGMILAHSFPIAITAREVTINQDMKSLMPFYPELATYLALMCAGFKTDILALVERSTHGTCKLESDKIFTFSFALPPLAEQSRIVARVEALRALCGQLRQRLVASRDTQGQLASALLAQG